MKHLFELSFPLSGEIMTTVRLAAGGVCALCGLDLETGEDCKVCITESLLLLRHRGFLSARVRFSRGERLLVDIEGEEAGEAAPSPEDEISLALLGALVGDLTPLKREDGVYGFSFSFGS